MPRAACRTALLVLLVACLALPAYPAPAPDAFAAKTKGATRRDGLFATWLDAKGGRLLVELPAPSGPRNVSASFLYIEGILTGLGSNPVGLDRGQLGDTRVVEFRRVGARVLLEQPNLRYRARSSDSSEVRAVRESFATSVLWGGEIAAEAADGRLLVDLTPFLVRDAHGAVASLKAAGQGGFSLDRDRSALDPSACLSFPDNLEFEALLTFAGDEPGREVRATAPTPQAITLVQHHSFVRLPDGGYTPRRWDPRSGSFEVMFADYAQPIAADLDIRWLVRHRLEKTDPSAERSRVKEPIVYYVDPGTPEPIRSALLEGASWWAKAFEAAGFIDAYQVKLLPAGAHPLDVRYNVIQWVHRATRGWSYGGGVIDPRTGEMIKGHVSLGSLRVRQDRMIFEGLAGVEKSGSGAADDPVQMSLARIRQLSAHEVGHTLGFSHNFAASSYAGRASVMDYPAPLVGVRADSSLDFSGVYATGAGAWDLQLVRYAYTQFPPGVDERAGLEAILAENRARGYLYLSDGDTRPAGAAHPLAAMWDNGDDPVAELRKALEVRRIALRRFGEGNITAGTPLSTLGAVLVPLYFHHRYQLEAAAKSI
ncbi:MAG TPA: zinc-dependent metalloprotease, partial [Candidatus Eisenbacteria bacterium]|nr:zinc-dependent metalloprotease [Candidatus Eisenbacteria bacterium]